MSKIIKTLSEKIDANKTFINEWFDKKFQEYNPLFYNSVDLRHNGVKIAPVDTNCFPAGFNNLAEISRKKAAQITDDFFKKNFSDAQKILIIPENHTRNLRYLENLFVLNEIIATKREVRIGSLLTDIIDKIELETENNNKIFLHKIVNENNKIITQEGFTPDIIILNNDLTDGIPQILKNVTTPIIPSVNIGWHSRTKSMHFDIYNKLAEELATILQIDPWLISSKHQAFNDINFKEQIGLESLAKYVDQIIMQLREKYSQYNIEDEPYCYIKADNGTYGMAVWAVFSGQEVLEINKKERNKMNMLKGAVQNTQVMIQEGIATIDKITGKTAEPMIYMINSEIVGNMFRANQERDEKISLNAAGAAFYDLENLTNDQINIAANKNDLEMVYSLIARLAALAAAVENKNSQQ